ncbi:MAG TPA: UDP-N-acetylglucosamine 1-carboxyvinyltransferase, partial [Thermotoga sp.]|nr:UDP-N-acetylglucosamine 1-carboxyvinyltransferase [Thermotoga sp.]
MGYFIVKGGVRLRGSVKVSGAKNSALPIMASSILANDDVVLKNVPDLQDVRTMMDILKHAGFS